MDLDPGSKRRARAEREDRLQDGGDHRQHSSGRGLAAGGLVSLASSGLSTAASVGCESKPCARGREEVAQLVADHPRGDHVCQRQPGGWAAGVPEERAGSAQGAERVRDLLLSDFNRHADAEQAVRDVQEHVPLGVSVPVVQEQQPEHMPTVPEQLCVCVRRAEAVYIDLERREVKELKV